jgi:hypothetical protein
MERKRERATGRIAARMRRVVQTWTLEGEHSVTAALTSEKSDSMSSREHGRGSGRKRAPDSAVLATMSSADDDDDDDDDADDDADEAMVGEEDGVVASCGQLEVVGTS